MPAKKKVPYSKRSVFWPCVSCRKNCTTGIKCVSCASWYHYDCENLLKDDVNGFQGAVPFSCFQCLRAEIGPTYSLTSGLLRLSMAATHGFTTLAAVAKRESIILQGTTLSQTRVHANPAHYNIDHVSSSYLQQHNMNDQGTPVCVTGNGNCLFNALSVALYDTEFYSTEFRVRTCIQLCLNVQLYVNRPNASDILLLSPTFEEACIDCARDHAFSSAWTIMATSDVLCRTINCIYPPCNGINDLAYTALHTCYHPSFVRPTGTVNVMWTSMSLHHIGTWTPKHFVPLLRQIQTFQSTTASPCQPQPYNLPTSPIQVPFNTNTTYQTSTPTKMNISQLSPICIDTSISQPDTDFTSDSDFISPVATPTKMKISQSSPIQSPICIDTSISQPFQMQPDTYFTSGRNNIHR